MIEVYRWNDLPQEQVTPQHSTAFGGTIQGERVEVCQLTYRAGTGAHPHSHPNEQVVVILSGCLRVRIGDDEAVLEPGMAVRFPSGTVHQAQATDEGDAIVISVKDIVAGKGHKI